MYARKRPQISQAAKKPGLCSKRPPLEKWPQESQADPTRCTAALTSRTMAPCISSPSRCRIRSSPRPVTLDRSHFPRENSVCGDANTTNIRRKGSAVGFARFAATECALAAQRTRCPIFHARLYSSRPTMSVRECPPLVRRNYRPRVHSVKPRR